MRNLSVLFLFFLFFNQAYSVLTISPEKDQESIEKAKEINNVAHVFIKQKRGYVECTASLIRPNIMITAAHCVQDTEYTKTGTPFLIQGFASFHANTKDAFEAYFNKVPNSFIPINAAIIHPDRNLNMSDSTADDVALIRLAENQDSPIFDLYKEEFKPQIEILLNPKSEKNYDADNFLMNCYGFGFGANVPNDSKRRYFAIPIESKKDAMDDVYFESFFFGPFPNNQTPNQDSIYFYNEKLNLNNRLSEKFKSPLHELPNDGDSGAPLLYNNYIIGVHSSGPNFGISCFDSVLGLYGLIDTGSAPLFGMDGKPIEKIYNMIPQLASFEVIEQKKAEDLINDYISKEFKSMLQAFKQTPFSNFFLECAEYKTYDIDAWKFYEFFRKEFHNLDLCPLIDAGNSYALKLRDMLVGKANP